MMQTCDPLLVVLMRVNGLNFSIFRSLVAYLFEVALHEPTMYWGDDCS